MKKLQSVYLPNLHARNQIRHFVQDGVGIVVINKLI